MKYLVSSQCINSDHIVNVEYYAAHETAGVSIQSMCNIVTDEPASEEGMGTIALRGKAADLFWEAYIGDAYTVMK